MRPVGGRHPRGGDFLSPGERSADIVVRRRDVSDLDLQGGRGAAVPATMTPTGTDWLRSVLFERGYLARIKGEAIKVYLVMIEACGGLPDASVTLSLRQIMDRTRLSCPTVIDGLARLEALGLVVSTTRRKGRVTTYYVSDPPEAPNSA